MFDEHLELLERVGVATKVLEVDSFTPGGCSGVVVEAKWIGLSAVVEPGREGQFKPLFQVWSLFLAYQPPPWFSAQLLALSSLSKSRVENSPKLE